VLWEHKESYKSKTDNLNAFKKLILNLPADGLLIYNQQDSSITPLLKYAKCETIPYNRDKINHPTLFGNAFENNFSAVKTLCNKLNIPIDNIINFKGLKNRLELIANKKEILFYDDYAQSAPRIESSISAIINKFPNKNIYVILEPHASFLQYKTSLLELKNTFKNVKHIFLSKISFTKQINKNNRVTFNDYKQIFDDKISYLPITNDLIKSVVSSLQPNDILVRFSSGGLDNQNAFINIIKNI